MSLLERFMGHPDPDRTDIDMVANVAIENPTSYQLLFTGALDIDADALTLALRSYHPDLEKARAEVMSVTIDDAPLNESKSLIGLAGWNEHIIKFVGFDAPIPAPVFEACVRPAHFSMQLKKDAQEHKSHLLLYYAGYHRDPLEQYVALTVVAAALARFDGILLLNENARSAFPAEALLVEEPTHDALDMLRAMPIPLLYGGFVKLEVEGQPGVWMRTYGNDFLKLPDLAYLAEGHHQGSDTFDMFANMLAYARETGKTFAPGHTMQIGDNVYLRMRHPTEAEWYLASRGQMLVAEHISAGQVNEPPA